MQCGRLNSSGEIEGYFTLFSFFGNIILNSNIKLLAIAIKDMGLK
jgi:hypothetical protein